jgi:hypothetical protein
LGAAAAVVQVVTWEEALRAGRVLFGTHADALLTGATWRGELKRAYKRRVLETHPDRARALGRGEAELAREFQAVAEAYRLLHEAPDANRWLRGRSPAPAAWRPPPRSGADAARAAHAEARRAEQARQQARDQEAARERSARSPRASAAADWRDVVKPRPLPRRRLRLAEYLYFTGRISWALMVEALAWQRRQRPAVGRIAVDYGFLTPLEVIEVIQRRTRAAANDVPFAEFALRLGMITQFERLAVVGRQTRLQRPIGQFFVERGVLREDQFEQLRRDIVRHNLRHYVKSA